MTTAAIRTREEELSQRYVGQRGTKKGNGRLKEAKQHENENDRG